MHGKIGCTALLLQHSQSTKKLSNPKKKALKPEFQGFLVVEIIGIDAVNGTRPHCVRPSPPLIKIKRSAQSFVFEIFRKCLSFVKIKKELIKIPLKWLFISSKYANNPIDCCLIRSLLIQRDVTSSSSHMHAGQRQP